MVPSIQDTYSFMREFSSHTYSVSVSQPIMKIVPTSTKIVFDSFIQCKCIECVLDHKFTPPTNFPNFRAEKCVYSITTANVIRPSSLCFRRNVPPWRRRIWRETARRNFLISKYLLFRPFAYLHVFYLARLDIEPYGCAHAVYAVDACATRVDM